jgi:hypothetical protein
MARDNIAFTLSANVATNGTFTVSYPTGRSSGSYSDTNNHMLVTTCGLYRFPRDFTISFGASSATITYLGSTTLPAGMAGFLELEILGDYPTNPINYRLNPGCQFVPSLIINLGSPVLGTSNSISLSQSVTASNGVGLALLNGSTAGVLDVPRNVIAAWTNTAVCTVRGTDVLGNAMTESSASGTSMTGKKAFAKVTSVNFSASVTGATVGTGNVLGLPIYIPDGTFIDLELKNGVAYGSLPRTHIMQGQINQTDLLAGTAQNLVAPIAGTIKRLRTIVQTAVTTGGTITLKEGTTLVAGLSVTVANAATVGTVAASTPTAGDASTVVAAGDRIQVVPASFATAGAVNYEIEISTNPIAQLLGTLVVGDNSTPTATTGDVRGTYVTPDTMDGTQGFSLIVYAPGPTNPGGLQYAG